MTTETNIQTFPVLSIDAWGNREDGYEWNQWFNIGTIDVDLDWCESELVDAMIDAGYLMPESVDLVYVDDDQYNLIFLDRKTGEPLFAIEYWPVLDAKGE